MHAALGTREQRSMIKDKNSQYRSNSIADTSEKIGLGNQQSVQVNSSIFNNLNLSSSLLTFFKYYYRLCKSQNQLLRYFHFFFPGPSQQTTSALLRSRVLNDCSKSQHKAHMSSFQLTINLQNRADWNHRPFFNTCIFS